MAGSDVVPVVGYSMAGSDVVPLGPLAVVVVLLWRNYVVNNMKMIR